MNIECLAALWLQVEFCTWQDRDVAGRCKIRLLTVQFSFEKAF